MGFVSQLTVTVGAPVGSGNIGAYIVDLVDATTGNKTRTLPVPRLNAHFYIKKVDSSVNTVTVVPHASETIDGDTSKILYVQYQSSHLVSDGTNWHIIF